MPLDKQAQAQGESTFLTTSGQINHPHTMNMPTKRITKKKDMVEAVRKITMANVALASPKSTTSRTTSSSPSSSTSPSKHQQQQQRRSKTNKTSGGVPENDTSTREVELLENGVHQNARKLNEHRLLVKERAHELAKLNDQLKTLRLETECLHEIQTHQTDGAKQILRLKTELKDVHEVMEEKALHQKQLEHMMQRLDKSHQTIHSFIKGMEEAIETCSTEYAEAQALHRQIEAGRTQAMIQSLEYQKELEFDRKQRQRELGDRESEARNAKRMEIWRDKRIQDRADMAAKVRYRHRIDWNAPFERSF